MFACHPARLLAFASISLTSASPSTSRPTLSGPSVQLAALLMLRLLRRCLPRRARHSPLAPGRFRWPPLKPRAPLCTSLRTSSPTTSTYFCLHRALTNVLCRSTWSLAVRATSMLPIGAGLGSSASYCTALAGALLRLRALTLCTGTPSRTHVNAWAFRAEQIIHGNPSGVDNHAATWGGALSFRGGNVKVLKKCGKKRKEREW